MAYATVADVVARNPYRAITATTKPTTTEVGDWLGETDAIINGVLAAGGMTSPNVDANGLEILKHKVSTYVSGLVEKAYAAAGGDGTNDDGDEKIDAFEAWIADLAKNPNKWKAILESATTSGSGTVTAARSIVTNNDGGINVKPADFIPEYRKGDLL